MHFFESTKIFVSFGSFKITWYAVLILTGAFLGYGLAQRTMKKWGYAKEVLEDYFLPMLIVSILGARAYYVIFEWGYYSQNLGEIIAIWHGGLAIHGGLIAGFIFSYFYFKKKNIDFLRMVDVIFPSVMIGQIFGRWGNFMNQEAFGGIVPESFYDHFPSFIKNMMYINGAYHAPTFLYESVGNLIGFLFIYFIFRKYLYRHRGDCGFMYLVWYGCIRFFIEGMRTDSLMIGPLRIAQIVSICFVVVGALGLSGILHKTFHWYKKPVLLFDLDGTLADTKELVFETFRRVFKEYKPEYTLSDEELYSFFGPILEVSFSKYFPTDQVQSIIDRYQEINLEIHNEYIQPMPHALETVQALYEQGYTMAVVSNKRHNVVLRGLKATKLDSYFSVVLGKEDIPEPKPSPSGLLEACNQLNVGHDDCIYVGDNGADVKAAKNIGVYSVGFNTDEKQLENLKKENPCEIIHDLKDLLDIVKEEKPWSDKSIW